MKKRNLINSILSLALATTMVFGPAMTTLAEDAAAPAVETTVQETAATETTELKTTEPKTTEPKTIEPETELRMKFICMHT